MKTNSIAMKTVVSAGFALCAALAIGNPAQAQGAGNRRVFRPMPSRGAASTTGTGSLSNRQAANGQTGAVAGVSGMGAGANGGGPGGNQGGGNGPQTPLIIGTIVAGDASAGQILIQSQSNGGSQTLQVSNATRFVTQTAITASDLETGEWVQVQGVATNTATGPASLAAATITAGQIPAFLQQNMRASGMGGNPPGNSSSSANARQTTVATQATNTVTLNGMITSVSPLVIKLHSGASVTVRATTDAQINRVTPLLFSQLQVGEQLKATGTNTFNGGFVLTDVAIDM